MNSFANFDFFDKQSEIVAAEQFTDESKAKEFDALLSNFAVAPVINAPVQENFAEPVSGTIQITAQSPKTVLSGENSFTETPPIAPPNFQKQVIQTEIKFESTATEKTFSTDSIPEISINALTDVFSGKITSPPLSKSESETMLSNAVNQMPLNSDFSEPRLTLNSIVNPAEKPQPKAEITFQTINNEKSLAPENSIADAQNSNAEADIEKLIDETENKIADSDLDVLQNKSQVEMPPIWEAKVLNTQKTPIAKEIEENELKEKSVLAGSIIAVRENKVSETVAALNTELPVNELSSRDENAFAVQEKTLDFPATINLPGAPITTNLPFENRVSAKSTVVRIEEQPVKLIRPENFKVRAEKRNEQALLVETKIPADVEKETSAFIKPEAPLNTELKTLSDINAKISTVADLEAPVDASRETATAIKLNAVSETKSNTPAENDSNTLTRKQSNVSTEPAGLELKASNESFDETLILENTTLPSDKLLSSEVEIKPTVSVDIKAPVSTPQVELPVKVKSTEQVTERVDVSDERIASVISSDVSPIAQTLDRKSNRELLQFSPKLENIYSAANVPVKLKNLFSFSNTKNPKRQDVASVSPASLDASPTSVPAESESFSVEDLPKVFHTILNSPDENIKAVNTLTSQKETAFDLQPDGEQLKRPESQSTKLTSNLAEISDDAESEKPIKLTDKLPAPFFERLSTAVKNGTQIADVTLAIDVQKADVFEQIEKPLLEAVILNAEIKEPEILKLRLRPAELGMVEVKLEKTDTNTIKIQFQTETDATQQILAENFDQLKTTLENSGWRVEPMEIISNQFTSNGNEQQREQNARQSVAENKLKEQTIFGSDAGEIGDSAEINADRLLSVRA